MKKASLLFILIGAAIACIAIGYGLLQKETPPTPLPNNPAEDPVVDTWAYHDQNKNPTITLTFGEDGQVSGTVLGDSFNGTWGKEEDVYYVYNSEGEEVFTAVFTGRKCQNEIIATATASGVDYEMVRET